LLKFATYLNRPQGKAQGDTVTLESDGHQRAYLAIDGCGVHVSAAP